ncbi:hypothetical protein AHAS_Ahas04G0268100 [Arachis hypogaea]
MMSVGTAVGNYTNDGIVTRCYIAREESQHQSKIGLRLEDGEITMDGWRQGNGNGQEEENVHGADSGSKMEAGTDGGSNFNREEQRPSWKEEMAENKKAWKLAVESGAQCSDEEDIMTILQEQNKAIALKRRQAKQKAKV